MRQNQKWGLVTVLFELRSYLFTFLILLGFQSYAFASGAKMPVIKTSDENISTATDTALNESDTGSAPPISDKYSYLDPENEVPRTLLNRTISYYQNHLDIIKNKTVIGIIDFSKSSSTERFYIINIETGRVDKYLVAHGKNSDPNHDGFATAFSNESGSLMSSLGFYLTAETYEGTHGYSLKLDGLSPTNSNARKRSIVMHPADYVSPGGIIGRSWGCPAVEPRYSAEIIDQIKDGSLIYASNIY